ncbi:MAG: hypoxanthine phosphoribosyltransferase [Desulfoprunum sp.]|jgi:hypoxanthine phosphoribosyltransferase|nr:hypoxanthine phosphoribosyltransferase [Desulfobulbus sp. Tol-SR]
MPDAGIDRVLITEGEITRTVRRLGREITACYSGIDRELVVVGLLRGSFVFMADLIRVIPLPLVVDFISVSTYGDGTVSSGELKVAMDLEQSIEDRDVLLVEDIVDTGHTFSHVIRMMQSRRPRSLKVCAFLDKPSRRTCAVDIDFCGITIPDAFVCGYGLDFAQRYRNLPYIGVLKTD